MQGQLGVKLHRRTERPSGGVQLRRGGEELEGARRCCGGEEERSQTQQQLQRRQLQGRRRGVGLTAPDAGRHGGGV